MSERNALHSIESVPLADGRQISFSSTGAAHGFPVLYMHGSVGSPLRRTPEMDAAIAAHDLRYLMVDRPGFRGSDPLPGRSVGALAADIEELADALGFGRFAVVGVSAGAPYALACAHRLGDRLSATLVVSPVTGPLHRSPGAQLRFRAPLAVLRGAPWLVRAIGIGIRGFVRRWPQTTARLMSLGASSADRGLLARPEDRDAAAARFLEALRGGARPMIEDYRVCCEPWGFEPAEVTTPVEVWHGARDKLVPLAEVRRLTEELPLGRLVLVLDGGHFLYKTRIAEILAAARNPGEEGVNTAA